MDLTFRTQWTSFIMIAALSGSSMAGGARVKTIEAQCKGDLLSPEIKIYVGNSTKSKEFPQPKPWQGKMIFIEQSPRLTTSDIERIDRPVNKVFKILFTPQGTEKLAMASKGNLGKQLVFEIDKQIIFTPEIKDEVPGNEAHISDLVLQDDKTLFEKMCPPQPSRPVRMTP